MTAAASTIDFTSSPSPAAYFLPSATYLSDIKATAANITSTYLRAPSTKELTRLPFRLGSQIDRAVFHAIPRLFLQNTGLSRWIDTPQGAINTHLGATVGAGGAAMPGVEQVLVDASSNSWTALIADAFQTSTFKSYWGMLQYLTSRWAFTCFAVALILNRIGVYGATRQRIYLTWNKRLAIRIVPILLIIPQIYHLLQAIQCQTSPEFSLYRHGDNNKYSLLDWSSDGGALHTISSTILFSSTDAQSCAAVGLSRPSPEKRAPYGSFSLLWPTFLRLSLSHLAESLSSSLQQIPQMTEVGMSVFEHSLAFAEAETMISHTLGLGVFSSIKPSNNTTVVSTSDVNTSDTIPASGTILALADATAALTGPHVLDRVNVPVEVLLVSLLSCCNALSSHVISVLGKQRQLRLINTGVWGVAFMASFVWGFSTTSSMVRGDEDGDNRPVSSLLHFPTVAIVGFLPHMLILLGIWICCNIYLIALTLTAFSLGTNPNIPKPTSLKQRFVIAHENLQAAIQFRTLNIRWYEDFYTALLRVGFTALIAASEAVFLNEGRSVEMRQFTWLEEERLDEIQASRTLNGEASDYSHFQIVEEYGLPPSSPGGTDKGGVWKSGYSKERKFDKKEGELAAKDSFIYPTPRTGGVGAVQRTTRFYLLFIYIRGILFLIGGYLAFGAGVLLDYIGITARPHWLRRVVGHSLKKKALDRNNSGVNRDGTDFWFSTKDGELGLAGNDDIDIETEMKKRVVLVDSGSGIADALDSKMYDWWKAGRWFGNRDESGTYQPSIKDDFDDTTSLISMSTNAGSTSNASEIDADDWESEGQTTPTEATHKPSWSFSNIRSRESTPDLHDTPLDVATLARLLNPKDKESREEARILGAHFSNTLETSSSPSRIMTRSQYRRQLENDRARVLLAGRIPQSSKSNRSTIPNISLYNTTPNEKDPHPLSSNEEAEVLESLILSRRKKPLRTGAENDDDTSTSNTGPPCVVCQTAPRTIIAWPCRCLCVCEDCRVSLALNNFGNCVTCRRTVGGFVRLYVP